MVPLVFEEQTSTKTADLVFAQVLPAGGFGLNLLVNPSIAAGSQKASFKYFALHVHHKLVGLSPTFETATYAYSGVNAQFVFRSISDSITCLRFRPPK